MGDHRYAVVVKREASLTGKERDVVLRVCGQCGRVLRYMSESDRFQNDNMPQPENGPCWIESVEAFADIITNEYEGEEASKDGGEETPA
jgi:hypothetical protein